MTKTFPVAIKPGIVVGMPDDGEFEGKLAPGRVLGAGEQDVIALMHADAADEGHANRTLPLWLAAGR